uniref:DUF4346 domain-containing protein n=1 Tax=Spyridia filamentosa TaxID=196632 RepID=A0A1Z1MJV6_SPYFI|nr:hypothetical protein [Spyridia filamentosa]ARW66169.1 hypothetical protein [Spyridia filamentosa]
MDNCYCIIKVLNSVIIAYCAYKDLNAISSPFLDYYICFTAHQSTHICRLLALHDFSENISLQHAFYLGQEFYKAEISLILSQEYIQE